MAGPSPDSSELIPAGRRIALVIEYDGGAFNGWQAQAGQPGVATVQDEVECALAAVAGQPVRLVCAGRTDSGVHATQQVAHFDAPAARSARSWLLGANSRLPDSVNLRFAQPVAEGFHARFSATGRRYRYLVLNAPVRSALLAGRVHWQRHALDAGAMRAAARQLLGERDFSSFRAAACQSLTPVRRVDFVDVSRRGELLVVDIQANAFLYRMVRNVVGALLAVGRGRLSALELGELLAARDRRLAPGGAPASGLYLVGVAYPERFGLPRRAPGPALLAGFDGLRAAP